MPRFNKTDQNKIEEVRKKKERTSEKVYEILSIICEDNPDVFKKKPEKRVKKTDRIIENLKEKSIASITKLETNIRDIAGTRVTCCTLDEILEVEDLIRNHPDIIDCKVLRTYDDGPDEQGYRGHHLEVKVNVSFGNKTYKDFCEIQIRTLAGDLWAVLSHRDFYKSSHNIPDTVKLDMKTLGKQLEVVDEMAQSLKIRIREEIDKKAKEKSTDKLSEEDMLTPINVIRLIKKIFNKEITVNLAYRLIQYALNYNLITLKKYKKILKNQKFKIFIEEPYTKLGIKPPFEDYLYAPILLQSEGESKTKNILERKANKIYAETIKTVEKGVNISKEELLKKSKTSSAN